MGITANVNGVLKALTRITANVNGTLKALNSVYANINGTLKLLHGGLPATLSGSVKTSSTSSFVDVFTGINVPVPCTLVFKATTTAAGNKRGGRGLQIIKNGQVLATPTLASQTEMSYTCALDPGSYSLKILAFDVSVPTSGPGSPSYFGLTVTYTISFT